jgi:uncharacterized protein (TIGR02265 family)
MPANADVRPCSAMATPPRAELSFVAPRTRFEIRVESVTSQVSDSIMSRGMFFNRCLGLIEGQDVEAVLRDAGLDEQRFVPFGNYPWTDFFRLAVAIANMICNGRTAAGLREIGRTLYTEFAESLAGRMLFGVFTTNADRVIGLGSKAWMMSGTPGLVTTESIGDRHYRYHFTDYPADVAETLAVGILEGALHHCGELAVIGFARVSETHAVIDVRWG